MTVYNKVVINNQTLMDISSDTVTPNTLLTGVTAHDNTGAAIIGTYTPTSGETINNQDKTITPTETRQYITADSGYTGLNQVTIEPIDSSYVGSNITQRTTNDLNAVGATVTVPAGYYSAQVTKSVAAGIAGTPTATKSTVNNNSITITPSVTNTTGYIAGGTLNGTAVSVTASELVSGTKSITENGTNIDVTNYATVSVDVPSVNISQDADGYIVMNDDGNYTPGEWTTDGIASGTEPNGDIVYDGTVLAKLAFAGSPITSFVGENVTTQGLWAFAGCSSLKTISLPKYTGTLNGLTWNNADAVLSELEHIYVPKVTALGNQWMQKMPKLKKLAVPSLTYVGINSLSTSQDTSATSCKLTTIDFGESMERFDGWAFNGSPNTLTTVILRRTSLVVASSNNSLPSRATNYYIPKSLYDHLGDGSSLDYQSANIWSTFYGNGYCNFMQIEGSEYENYYADGTPIE